MLSDVAAEKGVSRTIILADGSNWDGTVNVTTDRYTMFVNLDKGPTMAEAFMAFNDPSKTDKIKTMLKIPTAHYEKEEEYLGYTNLMDINIRGEEITIQLQIPR